MSVMLWRNIRLGKKLFIGFGLVLTLLFVISLGAILGIGRMVDDVSDLERRKDLIQDLREKEVAHLEWALEVSSSLVQGKVTTLQAETDPRLCPFGKWYYSEERKQVELLVPAVRESLSELEEPHRKLHESVKRIVAVSRQEQIPGEDIISTIYTSETSPYLYDFLKHLRRMIDEVEKDTSSAGKEVFRTESLIRTMIIVVSLLALALGTIMGVIITRSITRPLSRVVDAAERIAAGDLEVGVVASERKDELGTLTRTFTRMVHVIQETAHVAEKIAAGDLTVEVKPLSEKDVMGNALALMIRNLKEMSIQLRRGINILVSSISQISASTTELASISAQTATAVSETTATVEELKQTALVSSQKARHVAESAQEASKISRTGKKSTEDIVEGMTLIHNQMEAIAESVVRLSEQSQAIGEIIAMVNDLADQSNLLAVNASIEAAKAGEEGKGFSVVAQEIRNLAEQSKGATAQIRNILHDIQKATSAAVMATEQGSKAVESGARQSTQAGDSILSLADSIAKASQAAVQIAASSQQQLAGVDQVALAMENIEQASRQNVDSAKQLESAAQNLDELGQQLKQLAERYRA